MYPFFCPLVYIDNSYIQEKSYVCTTKVRILYKKKTKSPQFYLLRSKSVPFSHQKHPPYLLHRVFKTYVLINNIKVNTAMFLSMGFMK